MAERYRIIILPKASDHLEEIFAFIEQQSPQNARAVARTLIDAIDSLEQLPRRSRIHVSSRKPERVVYAMPVGPFIIYYHVLEQRKAVEVMVIRHGARRQPRRFP